MSNSAQHCSGNGMKAAAALLPTKSAFNTSVALKQRGSRRVLCFVRISALGGLRGEKCVSSSMEICRTHYSRVHLHIWKTRDENI